VADTIYDSVFTAEQHEKLDIKKGHSFSTDYTVEKYFFLLQIFTLTCATYNRTT
jgi:hypothetical protein